MEIKDIGMQIRSAESTREDGEDLYIEGYFSVFNSNYELWQGATESIDSHAFDNALGDDIRALVDHDTHLVLARNKAGTLELKIDSRGLWGKIRINPKDSDAMNLYERSVEMLTSVLLDLTFLTRKPSTGKMEQFIGQSRA